MQVRRATEDDAEGCREVYAPYVHGTAVTFETEVPALGDMAARIAAAHRWLVLEDAGRVAGYAYAGRFAPRASYRWACEVSVYLEPGLRRGGGGRALYTPLLAELEERGFRTVLAGMTLPNAASEGFHRALGFERAALYRRIGWKLGAWHDVAWMQRPLGVQDDALPPEPH